MKEKNREIFADFIRAFAIICVIIIHTTANYFVESYETPAFKWVLLVCSVTCCAVPLFYMISGCFLIKEENYSIGKAIKRSLQKYIALIIWSLIYFLIFKYILKQDINVLDLFLKSLFSSQVTHLWFMYPLIGLYVLTPIISVVYSWCKEKKDRMIYLLLITTIIPTILATLQGKYYIISIPYFSLGFPEIGLFILGKYLYDNRSKIENRKVRIFSLVGIILGYIGIIISAFYYINLNGISNIKPYFDYNKIPNLLMIVSIYVLFLSSSKFLNKLPNTIKKIIKIIGENTGGVYYVHMVFLSIFPIINIFGLRFTSNNGNLINMILGAFLYYIFSIIIVLIVKKIPLINKLFE